MSLRHEASLLDLVAKRVLDGATELAQAKTNGDIALLGSDRQARQMEGRVAARRRVVIVLYRHPRQAQLMTDPIAPCGPRGATIPQ